MCIMKKWAPYFILCLVVISLISCTITVDKTIENPEGTQRNRRRTISVRSDDVKLKIAYKGDVVLSPDATSIASISPNGSVVYKKNDATLTATPDANGRIVYEMFDGSNELTIEDEAGKTFLAAVVKEMQDCNRNN